MDNPEPQRKDFIAVQAFSMLVVALVVGAIVYAISHTANKVDAANAVFDGAAETRKTCTVKDFTNPEVVGGRTARGFSVEVETEQCGVLKINSQPPTGNKNALELYKRLEPGQTYAMAVDVSGKIFSAQAAQR